MATVPSVTLAQADVQEASARIKYLITVRNQTQRDLRRARRDLVKAQRRLDRLQAGKP